MSENYVKIISEMEKLCFPEEHWSENAVKDALERSDVVYGLEYDKGRKPVGYFIGAANQWEAELYRIAVLPEYRRNGYGKHLMEAFIDSCPKKLERIFLEVRENNTAARGLYERLGFSVVSVRRGYYGRDDGIVMEMKMD